MPSSTVKEQGIGITQTIAHANALLLAFATPLFPDASSSPLIRTRRPAGVQQPPDVGKFGITLAAEQVGQIDFEKAGAGEAGRVAQQPQLSAVADDAPLQRFAGVEQFLHGLERGFSTVAAALHGKLRIGLVQAQGVRGHEYRQAPGHEADRVAQFAHLLCWGGLQGGVTEGVAQQFVDEGGGDLRGIDVGAFHPRGEVLPLGAGDLEGAAVFVLDLDALGCAIVGLKLCAGAALGGFFQLVGQEQTTFELEGGQVQRGLGFADTFHVIRRHP
jgi:hypothetical protein